MSRSKRRRKYAEQQKAAETILENRDLKTNPLTAAEILALPRNQRPPRSEWPIEMLENPNPYPKREQRRLERSWGSSGSGVGFFDVIGFLILWAICAAVIYAANNALGYPYPWVFGIIGGFFSACLIIAIGKGGGSGGFTGDNWW